MSFSPSVGGLLFAAALLVILFGTVFAAVHHAEVIAHTIGEPFGTLLLTHKDWDRPALHKRSMTLLAEQIMPKLRRHLEKVKAAE